MRSFSASLGHTLPPGLGIGNVCALLQIDRRRNEGTLLHIAICDDEARHMRQLAALLDNGRSVALPRTSVTAFKSAWGNFWLGRLPPADMRRTVPMDAWERPPEHGKTEIPFRISVLKLQKAARTERNSLRASFTHGRPATERAAG